MPRHSPENKRDLNQTPPVTLLEGVPGENDQPISRSDAIKTTEQTQLQHFPSGDRYEDLGLVAKFEA